MLTKTLAWGVILVCVASADGVNEHAASAERADGSSRRQRISRLRGRRPIELHRADPVGLARTVSAAFIGLELYEGVDAAAAEAALDTLARLGTLAEVIDELGPVARRALRRAARRAAG